MKYSIGVGAYAYVFDEMGNLWLSTINYNGLVKYTLNTKEVEYIKQFTDYDITKRNLHAAARREGNRLFFFPLVSDTVHIYNIESKQENTIKIPQEKGVSSFFREIYQYEDFFVIFPTYLDGVIWRININTEEISKHETLTQFWGKFTKEEKANSAITFAGNEMVISLPAKKEILLLDLLTLKVKRIPINFEFVIHYMTKHENDLFVVVSDTFDVYNINLQTLSIVKYGVEEKAYYYKEKIAPYSDIKRIKECIFASNYYAKSICMIDKDGKVQDFNQYIPYDLKIMEQSGEGAIFCGIIEREEKIYFVPGRASHLIEYDYRSGECNCTEFSITKFKDKEMEEEFVYKLLSYQTEGLLTLKDLLSISISLT